MSESNAKPNENAKPAPKEQSQVTEQGLLHPILLSDESIKSSDEKEKPTPEGEQKLQEIREVCARVPVSYWAIGAGLQEW